MDANSISYEYVINKKWIDGTFKERGCICKNNTDSALELEATIRFLFFRETPKFSFDVPATAMPVTIQ